MPTADATPGEGAIFRKVALRLLPFLFLLYVINLIDRTNINRWKVPMAERRCPAWDEIVPPLSS